VFGLSRGEKVFLGVVAAFDLIAMPMLVLWAANATAGVVGGLASPWTGWAAVVGDSNVRGLYLVLAAGLLAGAVWVVVKVRGGGSGAGTQSKDTTYGSARWRSGRELLKGLSLWTAGSTTNPVGLVVGAYSQGGRVRRAHVVTQDGHTLLLGAPGAGKSAQVIEPTLTVIASGESVVVNDPKGELYQLTSGAFSLHDYEVLRFDLRQPPYSFRWNPVLPVAWALAEGDTARATQLARMLAQVLTAHSAPGGGGNDGFWRESTVALVTSLVLAVADQADDHTRNLASVYRVLTTTKDLDAFFEALPFGHPASQAYGAVRLSAGETRQSQLTVAAVALQLFADPAIAWLTSGDEFDPHSLAHGRKAVFVVVPDDSAAYYPVAALFVAQVLQALAAVASQTSSGRVPVPVHLVLDEFGSLPRLPDFEKALAVARGRGVRIHLVLQAFAQMDSVYGADAAQVMRNSCNTWVYLSSNDPDTAKIVSDKAGTATVSTRNESLNWQSAQAGRSESFGTTSRALLTPDEVGRWPFGESLVLQAGQLPARLPLRFFSEWPDSGYNAPAVAARRVAMPETWAPAGRPTERAAGDRGVPVGTSPTVEGAFLMDDVGDGVGTGA